MTTWLRDLWCCESKVSLSLTFPLGTGSPLPILTILLVHIYCHHTPFLFTVSFLWKTRAAHYSSRLSLTIIERLLFIYGWHRWKGGTRRIIVLVLHEERNTYPTPNKLKSCLPSQVKNIKSRLLFVRNNLGCLYDVMSQILKS